ncbi:MAG: hypothetical protein ACE5LV_01150 [Candidatus Aminicenantales bacterium]
MRRKFPVIVLGCVFILQMSWGSVEKDLSLTLMEKRIRDFSLEGLTLVFYVSIKNVSSKTYFLSAYSYRFVVEQKDYIQMETLLPDALLLSPEEETLVAFPVKITYKHLFRTIPEMERAHHAQCFLVGWAGISDGKRARGRVPLSFTGDFPIFHEPQVELSRLHVNTLTIGGADLTLEVKFANKNPFELLVERLRYEIGLGDKIVDRGTLAGNKNIQKLTDRTFSLPILMNFFEVGKEFSVLLQSSSIRCLFTGEMDVQTAWGPLTIPFNLKGNVRITRASSS